MFRTTLPAGNHVISQVQYHAPSTQTLLALCCGLMAYMTLTDTRMYKPEVGDYYIVTDHGTASLVKKAVFDGATKPMGPTIKRPPQYQIPDSMYIIRLARPEDVARVMAVDLGAGDDIARLFLFDPTAPQLNAISIATGWPNKEDIRRGLEDAGLIAKKDTLGMREENGYAEAPKKTNLNTPVMAGEVAKEAFRILDPVLNPKEMTKPEEAVRDFLAKHAAELDKMQNVIKSLTAQNDKKQAQITELQRQLRIRTDVTQRLNRLIDVCGKAKLI